MNIKLSKYIIPSVISMVLVGTYTNIDGFFIGNVTGDDGLAAINLAWPIVALITSLGTGIGVGGSVIMNKYRGEGKNDAAERTRSTMIMLLFAVGIVCSGLFTLLCRPLVILMGAEGQVLKYALEYSYVISAGAVFQIVGAGLVALLRNEQKTYLSMLSCFAGLLTHIILDLLLVEKYTLGGVGASTVISQVVIMLLCLITLRRDAGGRIDRSLILPILKCSTSPLGINFVSSVVLLLTNLFALAKAGTPGVSAYAVMSYAVCTFEYVFQGVCDGVQPIVSYCYGAGLAKEERGALRNCAITIFAFSLGFALLTPGLIAIMPKLFAVSDTARELMRSGFIIYAFSYPLKAAAKLVGSYFYSCGKTAISNTLIYIEPLLITPLTLVTLSAAFDMRGVWASLTVTQLILCSISIPLFLRSLKKREAEKTI